MEQSMAKDANSVLLELIRQETEQGQAPAPSYVLREAAAKLQMNEFELRELLWRLLTSNAVELTSDQRLRTKPTAAAATR
jgi:hypothetical protein